MELTQACLDAASLLFLLIKIGAYKSGMNLAESAPAATWRRTYQDGSIMSKVAVSVAALMALSLANGADAMTLYSTTPSTCASVAIEDLRFSLSGSTACMTDGSSNPTANAINALDPTASDWAQVERDSSASNAAGGLLTTNASFAGLPSGRAWSLSSSFWNTYGAAVIALRADPDDGEKKWVGFQLQAGSTSGTFSITGPSGSDLSALVLFGRGAQGAEKVPASVREPGTLALLGLGLVGLVFGRRRGGA